jgi:hypothetical protein
MMATAEGLLIKKIDCYLHYRIEAHRKDEYVGQISKNRFRSPETDETEKEMAVAGDQ